ncbi:hypothetical protein ACQHIV_28255 [Kribbella sp. GL6]|uniref:hypothetical protein n=1 Tax=Kribbella sp. GL6 TaxID=3419765 RepID=UPI003D0794D1
MDDIGAELRRLANTDPLDPIDGHDLLTRGRRSRRRRRLLSAGGGIVGVAAVAVAASLLPHAGTASDQPAVSGPRTPATTAKQADFTAVPGVPRGEAGIGLKLSKADAMRLCEVRYPQYHQPFRANFPWRTTMTVMRQLTTGDPAAASLCTIPGGDRPSAALIAAAQQDPLPTTEAGQLRNCSVQFWSDLTKWKVVARETQPGAGASLIALSPSGRLVAECQLRTKWTPAAESGSGIYPVATLTPQPFDQNFDLPGGQQCATIKPCPGWAYLDSGRVASNIARIRIEPVAGGKHDIPVTDGWYAVAWLNGNKQGLPDAKLTAYDKHGNVLKVVNH